MEIGIVIGSAQVRHHLPHLNIKVGSAYILVVGHQIQAMELLQFFGMVAMQIT
jgi:hypothetical protein